MENTLIKNLLDCERAFLLLADMRPATLAKKAAGDWRFFDRLRCDDPSTFTANKYDSTMDWFTDHWPDGAERPNCLTDHMALRQWEAANSYSCSAVLPRIVVPGAYPHQEEASG